jgi:hypothetical protein
MNQGKNKAGRPTRAACRRVEWVGAQRAGGDSLLSLVELLSGVLDDWSVLLLLAEDGSWLELLLDDGD